MAVLTGCGSGATCRKTPAPYRPESWRTHLRKCAGFFRRPCRGGCMLGAWFPGTFAPGYPPATLRDAADGARLMKP
jgi:hypothetical protein